VNDLFYFLSLLFFIFPFSIYFIFGFHFYFSLFLDLGKRCNMICDNYTCYRVVTYVTVTDHNHVTQRRS